MCINIYLVYLRTDYLQPDLSFLPLILRWNTNINLTFSQYPKGVSPQFVTTITRSSRCMMLSKFSSNRRLPICTKWIVAVRGSRACVKNWSREAPCTLVTEISTTEIGQGGARALLNKRKRRTIKRVGTFN